MAINILFLLFDQTFIPCGVSAISYNPDLVFDYYNFSSVFHVLKLVTYDCFIIAIYFLLQFVMEAWRVLEGNKIALSWKCYILIARALCNGGYLEEVWTLEHLSACLQFFMVV